MTTKFRLFDESLSIEQTKKEIQWDLCMLCQKKTGENLTFPGRNTKPDKNSGYGKVAEHLEEFHRLGRVPLGVDVLSLDDGSGLKETLINRAAGWHRSCYFEFSLSRLERARKRPCSDMDPRSISPVKTRTKKESFSPNTCIFCGGVGTRYHTLSMVSKELCSQEIYDCAVILKDTQLLGKLAGASDSMARTLKAVYHNRCRVNYIDRAKRPSTSSDNSGKSSLSGN